MQRPRRRALHALIAPETAHHERILADGHARILIRYLAGSSCLGWDLDAFRDRSIMIVTERQVTTALAVAELDGIARRLVLCTPDLSIAHRRSAFDDAAIDIVLTDSDAVAAELPPGATHATCGTRLHALPTFVERDVQTEWVLFTSGTTGQPKLAVHTLSSLIGPFADDRGGARPRWSTFYDVRRYGGLQILLRALVGGGSMILSDPSEPVAAFLARVGAEGVTHISGTPSHWRRVLMSDAAARISPGHVRLSGEVADQPILDSLRRCYPDAEVAHAFASTEAGVAFTVRDGRAGFPASLIGRQADGVELGVRDGTLRVRSGRIARCYLGSDRGALSDGDGFVDTGDLVELQGDRYHFVGRRGGIINVGGEKVHPERVEAVINRHDAVLMSRVSARSSPITGALVVAEVVLTSAGLRPRNSASIEGEILDLCRRELLPHQVPAILREVPSLNVSPSGKLERLRA